LGEADADEGRNDDCGRFVEGHYRLAAGEEGHVVGEREGWWMEGVVRLRLSRFIARLFLFVGEGVVLCEGSYGRALSLRSRSASAIDCFDVDLCMCCIATACYGM
jgi:hypothetical protein